MNQGDLKPEDFSIRDLAESFLPGGLGEIELAPMEAAIPFVNTVGAVIDGEQSQSV
jgi:hypothetical protein